MSGRLLRLVRASSVLCLTLLGAREANAIPQPPHDAATHGIQCLDCHVPFASRNDPAAATGVAGAASTPTQLSDPGKAWVPDQWIGGVVTFVGGANDGQFRAITGNTATTLTWALPLPAPLAAGLAYRIGKTTYADIETNCRSCHNPAGQAPTFAKIGLHHTPNGDIGCGKCHDPHNVTPTSGGGGNGLIRETPRWPTATTPVVFPSGNANRFLGGAPAFNGICEVCHTQAANHRNNASGNHTHNKRLDCTFCHSHETGFGRNPPQAAEWATSAHADAMAPAFNNWNASGSIPTSCARCHSAEGYVDYLGGDGTAVDVVNNPAPTGGVVDCSACHDPSATARTSVTFPSGVVVANLGPDARCMVCHQGRSSTPTVDTYLAATPLATPDTVSAALRFQNVHHMAAGATLYGSVAQGGYQYAGKSYDVNNRHVPERDTCIECHNQHSLAVRLTDCRVCHLAVRQVSDVRNIRMYGSTGDYDGDGNIVEGMYRELDGVGTILLSAIRAYASRVAGAAIVYDPTTNPYFFLDANNNNLHDVGEVTYNRFTPRLLRATYNYQFYKMDPGAYAHHPKYTVELMHDSIDDLNAALGVNAVPFLGDREDGGHFDGSALPFRDWDATGIVPGEVRIAGGANSTSNCSRCHGGQAGFRYFLTNGVTAEVPATNGMECTTCHNSLRTFSVVDVPRVTFPGGAVLVAANHEDNLCMTCHQGRESKASVDAAIAANTLGFKNIHYLPAGASMYGSEVGVGYQYAGKIYAGRGTHPGGISCVDCHSPRNTRHSYDVLDNVGRCEGCHGSTDIQSFRSSDRNNDDYDGDGLAETLVEELAGTTARLYAAIQASARAAGNPLVYDTLTYPYFFRDTNNNGLLDAGENAPANKFVAWTPALMRATFNFQFVQKEPGAWAHNFDYMDELLYDGIQNLGGNLAGMVRP